MADSQKGVKMLNLNKRAMKYAKLNNYYRPSKIKKYLILLEKKIKKLHDDLIPSKCPECGSNCTKIGFDDRHSCYDSLVHCDVCGESYYDDEYIEKCAEIEDFNYFDSIEMLVWSKNFKPGKGYKWFKECDNEMNIMIKKLSS